MIDINKQEEVIKNDLKESDRMWKESSKKHTLEEFLDGMTKDELVGIGKKYFVKGLTSLKKADLVERIKNIIIDSHNMSIEVLDEKVLNFLQDLLMSDEEKSYESDDILYVTYLRKRGVVFSGTIDGKLFIFIPNELEVLLKESITDVSIKNSKVNNEIIRVISGMAYYYGVISIDLIIKNIDIIFGESFSEDRVKQLIEIGQELGYDYVLEDDMVCHIDVEDVDGILELQNTKDIEYCKYDKKTLLKSGERDFIEESKQSEKLKKVFAELFVIDKKILKQEVEEFIIAIKNEMDKEEAIDIFLEAYQIENDEERAIFIEELKSFAKSIKRWSYKGYSEDEFDKNNKRVVNKVTIGRNDPCTCGSGKKYKKCCGK